MEEALAKAGAEPGDTVLIGDLDDAVVFDWDPELPAGGGHAPGPRGTDRRLEEAMQDAPGDDRGLTGSARRPTRRRPDIAGRRGPSSRSVPRR